MLVVPELSDSTERWIFLDQGSNPPLLKWQVDSVPLSGGAAPQFFFSSYSREILGKSLTGPVQKQTNKMYFKGPHTLSSSELLFLQ